MSVEETPNYQLHTFELIDDMGKFPEFYSSDMTTIDTLIKSFTERIEAFESTDTNWTKAKDLIVKYLSQWYLSENPYWLWDLFPFEDGDTNTEAERQADIAMSDRVYHYTPIGEAVYPYAIVLTDGSDYNVRVVEDGSTAAASLILSNTNSTLMGATSDSNSICTTRFILYSSNLS